MCDQLKVYKVYTTRNDGAFGFCEDADPTDIELEHESVCLKSDVDKVIAELEEKLHDVDNKWNEQCKEIAELKAKNRVLQSFYDLHGNVDNYIDQLKAKLESVQAMAYADSVDAGMRERRLKRALWIARAERADDRARIFYFSDLESVLDIDGFSYDSKKKKGCKKLTARLWRIIWLNVERKCRDKAELYK